MEIIVKRTEPINHQQLTEEIEAYVGDGNVASIGHSFGDVTVGLDGQVIISSEGVDDVTDIIVAHVAMTTVSREKEIRDYLVDKFGSDVVVWDFTKMSAADKWLCLELAFRSKVRL